MVQWVKNPTAVAWVAEEVQVPSQLVQWVKVFALLHLWQRSAAVAQIQSLAQELTYASSGAIKKKKAFPLWRSG